MKKFKSVIALLLALIMAVTCGVSAFAATVSETEGNDDKDNATAITLEDTASGRLEVAGDKDWYSVTFAQAGMAAVKFNHSTVDAHMTYFTVSVYDAECKLENEFTVYGDEAETVSSMFSVSAGKHYIVIGEGQIASTTLAYTFTISFDTEAKAEKESNNTFETASPLEISTSGNAKRYLGSISEGDVDNFVFNVPDEGFIYFYIYNSNGKAGNYTATVSTYIEGAGGVAEKAVLGSVSINKSEASVISAPIGVGIGKFYLTISGTVGGYETRVFFSRSSELYETEYNNTLKTADYYSVGTKMAGSTYDINDVDCYKFTVTEKNRQVYLEVKGGAEVVGTAKWIVTVVDKDNATVASEVASNSEPAKILLNDKAVGTYYLIIKPDSSYVNNGHYYIGTSKYDVPEKEKSFFEKIKAIDWSGFLDNFKGWLGKIDFVGIIKSIYVSIRTVIEAI